jgi:hypothetical protein
VKRNEHNAGMKEGTVLTGNDLLDAIQVKDIAQLVRKL